MKTWKMAVGISFLTAGFAFAGGSPEAQKAQAAGQIVVTNDNIASMIQNSRISVVGNKTSAAQAAPEAEPSKPIHIVPLAETRAVERFSLGLVTICDNKLFVIPSWCPQAGPGVVGGLYHEIDVHQGDEVEITLQDGWLNAGDAFNTFNLTAADPIESCSAENIADPYSEFNLSMLSDPKSCAVSVLVRTPLYAVVRFVADQTGTFKYYDSLHRSGYGLLVVKP